MSEGSITKRGESWMLKYEGGKDATGKRRQLYKTVRGTRKEADRELRRLLGQLDEGTHVDPQKMTLAQWIEIWVRDYAAPTVSAKTLERYSELLRLHVVPYIGQQAMQKLTSGDLQCLYTKLRTIGRLRSKTKRSAAELAQPAKVEGLAERTVLHVHRVLSQALSQAARQRVIVRNPADDAKAPRPEAGQAADGEEGAGEVIKALEREPLVALLRGLRDEWIFPIATTDAGTGMRRGEILALRRSDIGLDARTIRIERAVEETNKKGRDGKTIRFKAPKNKSSKRTISIDPGLAAFLRGHMARQAEEALKLGTHPARDWLLFPKSIAEPTTPIRPRNVSKRFSILAARLGFPGLRFHDLRHTHATLLLTAGVPINAVSQRLGHSTPVITLTVYGHVLPRADAQAATVSGTLLEGAITNA